VALPEPRPGLVIRYDYLWVAEAAAGRDQGEGSGFTRAAQIRKQLNMRGGMFPE
jgi:hypothetical protein